MLETQERGAGRDFQTCQIQSLLLQQHITMPFRSWSPHSLKSYLDFCPCGSYWAAAPNPIALMVWSPQLISSSVYSWPVYIHLFSCQHCPLAEITLLPPWCLLPISIYRKPSPALLRRYDFFLPAILERIQSPDLSPHFNSSGPHAITSSPSASPYPTWKKSCSLQNIVFSLGNRSLVWVLREISSSSLAFPPPGVFLEGATVSQCASPIKPYTKRAPTLAAASSNSNSMRNNGRGNCKLCENMQIHSLNNSHELWHIKVEKKLDSCV